METAASSATHHSSDISKQGATKYGGPGGGQSHPCKRLQALHEHWVAAMRPVSTAWARAAAAWVVQSDDLSRGRLAVPTLHGRPLMTRNPFLRTVPACWGYVSDAPDSADSKCRSCTAQAASLQRCAAALSSSPGSPLPTDWVAPASHAGPDGKACSPLAETATRKARHAAATSRRKQGAHVLLSVTHATV